MGESQRSMKSSSDFNAHGDFPVETPNASHLWATMWVRFDVSWLIEMKHTSWFHIKATKIMSYYSQGVFIVKSPGKDRVSNSHNDRINDTLVWRITFPFAIVTLTRLSLFEVKVNWHRLTVSGKWFFVISNIYSLLIHTTKKIWI